MEKPLDEYKKIKEGDVSVRLSRNLKNLKGWPGSKSRNMEIIMVMIILIFLQKMLIMPCLE